MDPELPSDESRSGPPARLAATESAADDGISLDKLSQAFAQMLGTKRQGAADDARGAAAEQQRADSDSDQSAAERVANTEVTPASILEAMLFVGSPQNEPLAPNVAASLLRGVDAAEIPDLVRELHSRYSEDACPYQIVCQGTGYRLVLREPFYRVRDKFYGKARQARLSPAAVEVLAVVAYNQPVTSDQVARLRGTPGGAILSLLVRRGLLRIERPDQKPRRPQYFTTDRFLQLFNLSSLDDLPQSQELEKQ